jgi:hypothetical protein
MTHTQPELLNGDIIEALATKVVLEWKMSDISDGKGELNLVAAVTQGVLTDLYSFGSELRNYYNLSKKDKGQVIESIFFQVLGLEGRASTKNPEGFTDTWAKKLDKVLPLMVYMVQRSLFVGVASMNNKGEQQFTIPAFLAGRDTLNGVDHVDTNDLAFAKSYARKHFDARRVKEEAVKTESSTPQTDSQEDTEQVSMSTLVAQAQNGDIDFETTLAILEHTTLIIEALPNNMSDTLHTAIATLVMVANTKLRLATVSDGDNSKVA